MKTITLLLCVATAAAVYLRAPTLDRVEVHTERIGGSFAYKTSELLVYAPIVCFSAPCPFLTVSYRPLSALLAQATGAVAVDVPEESQPEPEPVHDSVVTLSDDDTVTIEANPDAE